MDILIDENEGASRLASSGELGSRSVVLFDNGIREC